MQWGLIAKLNEEKARNFPISNIREELKEKFKEEDVNIGNQQNFRKMVFSQKVYLSALISK